MNKEQALLALKWMVTARIDGYWGAGDAHLVMLEILSEIGREDPKITGLWIRLKKRSKSYDERYANPETRKKFVESNEKFNREYHANLPIDPEGFKSESVYRDAGKDEAEHYAKLIKEKYGEKFFDEIENAYYGLS